MQYEQIIQVIEELSKIQIKDEIRVEIMLPINDFNMTLRLVENHLLHYSENRNSHKIGEYEVTFSKIGIKIIHKHITVRIKIKYSTLEELKGINDTLNEQSTPSKE